MNTVNYINSEIFISKGYMLRCVLHDRGTEEWENSGGIMTEIDVATRHRQVTILQCMVAKDEDEIIWTLSMNKDIMKKELGFGKYLTSYIPCICISMNEKKLFCINANIVFDLLQSTKVVIECAFVDKCSRNYATIITYFTSKSYRDGYWKDGVRTWSIQQTTFRNMQQLRFCTAHVL